MYSGYGLLCRIFRVCVYTYVFWVWTAVSHFQGMCVYLCILGGPQWRPPRITHCSFRTSKISVLALVQQFTRFGTNIHFLTFPF